MKDTHYIVQRLAGFSFYSALIKIVWGIVFLQTPNLFETSVSYTAMASIGTEMFWGIGLFIIGVIHVISIFSRSLYLRISMQIVSIFVWLFIATQFWVSNPIGTGKLTYTIAACIDFIAIVYILRFDGGKYD